MKYDVVYILANKIKTDEVRYSVRSVVKNFPYNRIVFYGGKPEFMDPDVYVHVDQIGYDRYDKVCYTLEKVCADDNLTESFWLFNDDFFIMKPMDGMPYAYKGMLDERIAELDARYGPTGGYIRAQKAVKNYLETKGYTTYNYGLHVPMLINRKDAARVLEEHPNQKLFRALYGNVCGVGGMHMDDVKIYDNSVEPDHDAPLLSTKDCTFKYGRVGDYIRKVLTEPTKYERMVNLYGLDN